MEEECTKKFIAWHTDKMIDEVYEEVYERCHIVGYPKNNLKLMKDHSVTQCSVEIARGLIRILFFANNQNLRVYSAPQNESVHLTVSA
jgi:hypothetical protein